MSAIDLNKIVGIMDDAQIATEKRGAILTLAIARSIGYALDLPAERTQDAGMFYISNLQGYVETIVSQVNEQIAIDVERACDLIKSVWTFRYRLVYQPTNPTIRTFLDAIVKVGSSEFPGYVSELMIALPDNNLLEYISNIVSASFIPKE